MPYLLELRHQLKGGIQGHGNRNLPAPKNGFRLCDAYAPYYPYHRCSKIKLIVSVYTST